MDLLLKINGGNTNSPKNLDECMKKGYQKKMGIHKDKFREILIEIGNTWPPIIELNKATQALMNHRVYTLHFEHPVFHEKIHTSLSTLWCSLEIIVLSYMVQASIEYSTDKEFFLPVALESDGLLIFSNSPRKEDYVAYVEQNLKSFGRQMDWEVPLLLEIKNKVH